MDMIFWTLAGLGAAAVGGPAPAQRGGARPASGHGDEGRAGPRGGEKYPKYTGVGLGFNVFNGLVAGILGVPGVVLLVLVQWVLT